MSASSNTYSAGLNHLINGGLAGFSGAFFVQPFQVIKTAFQVRPYSHCSPTEIVARPSTKSSIFKIGKFIYEQEGIKGLYRGLVPGCLKSSISSAAFFYLLSFTRKIGKLTNNKTLGDFIAAVLARTAQTFITNPILVVKTRFEVIGFNEYSGIADAFIKIYQKEGLKSLFTNGVFYALIKDVPFSAIQFPVYEMIKCKILSLTNPNQHGNVYIKPIIYGMSSMGASLIGCLLTNPIDVIRTRVVFQYYNKNKTQHYNGVMDGISKILKYDGWRGMFYGLQSRFLKKVIWGMIAWPIYETLVDWQRKKFAE